MFKISDISKIRVLTKKLDLHNLQTKIVSFPSQVKLLKEVVFGLAVSKEPTCTIYRPGKTSEKWLRVKSYLLKYATIKNLQYQQCPKI